jgi:hypothetical protein
MRTTRHPRIRVALRLFSTAFVVTALLASGGTASAAKKKAKAEAPAADQAETPPAPAAAAPAEQTPAPAEPAPAAAPAPVPASAPVATPAPAPAPAPAAAPEATTTQPEPSAASPQRKRSTKTTELGLSPQTTSYAADNTGPPVATEAPAEDWGFKFHGFFRGPMRLSMGTEPGRGIQFHAPPVTPDLNYTTWQYTNNNPGPWGEAILQYGNNRAIMTMAIASYNITSGGWRELQDQLGIDRAFLTLNFPDALGDIGKMTWNVGVFSDRYGAMGKYDGGAYDTYLIGRTRIAGATGTFDFDLADEFRLVVEGGFGAKMDVERWQKYPYTSWQPYPGFAQMGTTLLGHLHVGAVIDNIWTFTLHYMDTFTMDAMRTDLNSGLRMSSTDPSNTASILAAPAQPNSAKDGNMRILGADLRLDGGWMGIGYLGFSSIKGSNAGVLQDSIEVIHSQGGWQFTNNYLGNRGNGTVNNIGFQYTFSLAAFMLRPQAWWGQGADFTVQIFGIYTWITGTEAATGTALFAGITGPDGLGSKKLKLGTQLLYTPLPFMSAGLRIDSVQPNLDNSTHTVNVFSPRLIFRTEFVTHEQITLQYQYYNYGSWYNQSANAQGMPWPGLPYPYGQIGNLWMPLKPDKHTISIAASMWW